jgi:hypothetical protein
MALDRRSKQISGDVVATRHGSIVGPTIGNGCPATFIAVGAGIKPGTRLKTFSNLDVASTIANLLSVPLPTAEGRVLKEILSE